MLGLNTFFNNMAMPDGFVMGPGTWDQGHGTKGDRGPGTWDQGGPGNDPEALCSKNPSSELATHGPRCQHNKNRLVFSDLGV